MPSPRERVTVALDTPDLDRALEWAAAVRGHATVTFNPDPIASVSAADIWRLRVVRESGSDVLRTVADGSSITIILEEFIHE